mmetsp:Transcript_30498/g.60349  ORF Transcript_30498/g.60349 Transcript_30498/m.60349 type:complete len:213 (-) Transcript_30498:1102-1740(-)
MVEAEVLLSSRDQQLMHQSSEIRILSSSPLATNSTDRTLPRMLQNVWIQEPSAASHILAVPSCEPETKRWPSPTVQTATSVTPMECPEKVLRHSPVDASHQRTGPSRDPVRNDCKLTLVAQVIVSVWSWNDLTADCSCMRSHNTKLRVTVLHVSVYWFLAYIATNSSSLRQTISSTWQSLKSLLLREKSPRRSRFLDHNFIAPSSPQSVRIY